MFRKLRGIFGGGQDVPAGGESFGLSSLDAGEKQKIGTEDDPMRGYEAAVERHEEAMRAEQGGDPERARGLYEQSVAERFVGSHPYEMLATLHERSRSYPDALRVRESYKALAKSGRMPRGAQSSADRKLPEFEARMRRYRRLLEEDQTRKQG